MRTRTAGRLRATNIRMRILIAILFALIGLVAGWSALAALVIALAGPGNDGGIAMGAVFAIGPVGGLAGLIAGIWLFRRFGPSNDQDAPLPASRGEDSA
ncbi:MAG: hypothetical protein ACOY3N_18705 [Bradyrhizobium sp.]|uniref:hypothetical protein n=2 Tax=Nitrobacteraceae TaxID=41294 RepID=UPI000A68FCC5